MKRNIPFVFFLLTTMFGYAQSNIIISQYIETNLGITPKGIELFNVSGSDITFSGANNLEVFIGVNGNPCSTSVISITSGTLAANEVWVIGDSTLSTYATTNGTNLSGTTVQTFSFNGDDALSVFLGGTIQDMFGVCGTDPGSAWTASGVSTRNNNIQIKDGLCDGDVDGWADPSVRFDQIANGSTMTGFGNAPAACSSACTPTQTITSFAPTTGPELSYITITGSGFTASSTVELDGTATTIISQTATQIVVEVPIGATTGVLTVTEAGCPLDSTTDFTVLSGSCSGGGGGMPAGFTDLMFSGIYDDQTDSCHYFELLNPTSSAIDLTDYTVGLDNNFTLGSAAPTSGFTGGTLALTGTLAAETTIMIRLSSAGACTSCPSVTPDLSYINGGINDEDRLVLVKDFGTGSATAQDVFQNHTTPGVGYNKGYVFTRDFSATAPSSTFSLVDWNHDGDEDCFGFAITITPSPTIDTQPLDIDNCDAADINISVTTGGGGSLNYQWKYNYGTSNWLDVTSAAFSTGIVTGETSTDLSISGFNLDGYQFYCEVTETGVCTIATNGIQITMSKTIWNGAAWSDGTPDLTKMAILNGSYNTNTNGSFQACSLIINSSGTATENNLTITDNTFVEIENTITVDGELYVESKGALVQNNDDSNFNLTSNGESLVNKMTTPINSIHEYTYWSSPVANTTVQDALAFSNPNRRYWFNAANFLDVLDEVDNTNTYVAGSDGIDDNGDDWTYYGSGAMTPGVGYVSMHSSVGFIPGLQYTYTFNGAFNNGIINAPISYNGANGDEDWNLIGNPYPSAIDANAFLADNSGVLQGVAYLWSQNTPADSNTSGNQNSNFSVSDYAIITNGSGNTAGGDGVIPTNHIPSGQSFFVQGLANGNAVFNNSHRMADTSSNSQFFRTNTTLSNRLWVNLTSDNGVFNQILVAYVNGASDLKDSMSYDATRSLYNENNAEIYTSIPNETEKFAIQGKAPESLTIDEIIPLGFSNKINAATIYTLSIAQFEGDFFTNNTTFLVDNLTGTVHDLTASDYSFTSEVGDFSNRFEVVFNTESLSTNDFDTNINSLSIIELNNDDVKFSISNNLTFKSIKILDVLGREIYAFKASKSVETYNLSKLNENLYFAQIKLSNGQDIIKKAIKK